MIELITIQQKLMAKAEVLNHRYLFDSINWKSRLIGIKGARGTGKTTLLLQKIAELERGKGLYASADHPYFYGNGFYELAEEFVSQGGKLLAFDEVHRFPNWSQELKAIYDSFPELHVLFSSSSALNIFKGEGDLSRRASVYELKGFSFREYLAFKKGKQFSKISLDEILETHSEIVPGFLDDWKPLVDFAEYLRYGYFPFGLELEEEEYHKRLANVINTVLDIDLMAIEGYSVSNTFKIKRLLSAISQTVPFEPNISALSRDLGIARDTISVYFNNLENAKILNFLYSDKKGVSALRKPSKIYLENSNLNFVLERMPNVGTLRETFVLNQLKNANYDVARSKLVDFTINDKVEIEVGGKKKNYKQLRGNNGYILSDDIELGIGNKIPLWLLGFVY